jgi:hypothetical protein
VYVPAGQAVQSEALIGEYIPAGHLLHGEVVMVALSPPRPKQPGAYEPAGQAGQAVQAPGVVAVQPGLYWRAGQAAQAEQIVAPAVLL